MGRKKKKNKKEKKSLLPAEIKQMIWGVFSIVVAVIISLSFFGKAGRAGAWFIKASNFLVGNTIFLTPLIFILAGLILLFSKNKEKGILKEAARAFCPVILAVLLLLLGITGVLGSVNPEIKNGGWVGFILSWPFLNYFGFWATFIIFFASIVVGSLIFFKFLGFSFFNKKEPKDLDKDDLIKEETDNFEEKQPKTSIIKKIFAPRFKVKEISPSKEEQKINVQTDEQDDLKEVKIEAKAKGKKFSYIPPPLDLLTREKGVPNSGDTKVNSVIIKKMLQNFGIDVTMSEVNIGPTVTQYTLKPAEGIKLSKITGLSNDLALALAAHPIRIEAPIPGRSLVGIEVPNKGRAEVRLRNLIENDSFQKSTKGLALILGRDVAGFPVLADLTKMPHLLVAGATGTGKTIFLNSLIANLLYQPTTSIKSAGPETLRLIMIDPKRVEFPIYNKLPHLLCPVIYSASQTVNALRWLTEEMERRFDILASCHSRDIGSFNERALASGEDLLPFIIVIIDELADLMMAKGREIEAGIVRLAQMARAVGIHLIVATQRPSVEVITGLIKANITSRITFQVASQIDSRTIIDTSGAEKLLGLGDMLYISAQTPKPKRIQGAYVSDKEIKKIVNYIELNSGFTAEMDDGLVQELNRNIEGAESGPVSFYGEENNSEEPLYEEAKRVVIESKRASASLLQRRLRVGYARAARLIDMLEDNGIVGPQEGSKPREVFGGSAVENANFQGGDIPVPPGQGNKGEEESREKGEGDGWEKV